jgi:hypothetical protein
MLKGICSFEKCEWGIYKSPFGAHKERRLYMHFKINKTGRRFKVAIARK